LHQGHLIGRLDAKSHRGEGHLEARHVHLEPWVRGGEPTRGGRARLDQEGMLAGVAEALASLGAFLGAERVTVDRVAPGRLRAPAVRALRGTRPADAPAAGEGAGST